MNNAVKINSMMRQAEYEFAERVAEIIRKEKIRLDENILRYKEIFIPALYAAPDELLERLKQYVADGGTLVATFKTAFANENIKVSHEMQPHILSNCFGINYQQFTFPKNVGLTESIIRESGADEADKKNETKEIIETEENTDVPATAKVFMELLIPQESTVYKGLHRVGI